MQKINNEAVYNSVEQFIILGNNITTAIKKTGVSHSCFYDRIKQEERDKLKALKEKHCPPVKNSRSLKRQEIAEIIEAFVECHSIIEVTKKLPYNYKQVNLAVSKYFGTILTEHSEVIVLQSKINQPV